MAAPQRAFATHNRDTSFETASSNPGLGMTRPILEIVYPASKIAALNELRNSGLNWSILRLPLSTRGGRTSGGGREVQVAPDEDVQPRSPADVACMPANEFLTDLVSLMPIFPGVMVD